MSSKEGTAADRDRMEIDGLSAEPDGELRAILEEVAGMVIGILVHDALVHTETTAQLHLTGTATTAGVRVEVADEGPGVAPEVASRVFDRFYRGDRSRGRRTGSSGLDLAIARSIGEAHGGTITLTSEPTRGSRFTVELPGRPSTPEGFTCAAEPGVRPPSNGTPPRRVTTPRKSSR